MSHYLCIALGGAIGAILRFMICGMASKYAKTGFPYGTMLVNIAGAFIIGLLWYFIESSKVSSHVRMLFLVGLIGSFTTFSTFTLETLNLFRNGEIKFAFMNVFASNLFGLAAVFAGLNVPRFFTEFFTNIGK